mmetsp:Transcript_57662/g.122669  ORF Transcript_57662/g.122669 Transcript_57662/m.122669 type:complete len:659 (-) Transcript_57662:27-2003(-)|eukprot:CAMPEP_0206572386 /NCGR_PEP_ID=MMETSP0325_2-20121206/28218_1 /ASSEMBLY_ACC=CAM_ASM_000347 /TAXON_ID=2866 /ORGANISM="Crypthecodinium cohnii, Strain Seligo" /LENGTH=658 /DNA_ID=CAMNT_0054076587 /DNA_START=130 /DNA_END=2106 /DNA_ORIENTATION=+
MSGSTLKTLHVLTPNGEYRCAGEYVPVQGQEANGHPIWKQAGGAFWLYTGTNGMWIIGAGDAAEKKFQCSRGNIFCKTLHGGILPDRVTGGWWRLTAEKDFVDDDDIRVVPAGSKPLQLRVTVPNGPSQCAGDYVLVPGEMISGMPLWRLRDGKLWLYSGLNGSWIIGGSDAKDRSFHCNKGILYSKRAHGGHMPDRVGGLWLRLGENGFEEDASIRVALRAASLYLDSSKGQQGCSGEYLPVLDKVVNSMPIWEHISRKCWLYSGPNGMWIVGGDDARAKNFKTTRGVIFCRTPHLGLMPDKHVGCWLRLEGDRFREDATINISAKPNLLYVVTPQGHYKASGEYRLCPGEYINGLPIWKQKHGFYRIYSSRNGTWEISGNEASPYEFQDTDSILRTEDPHQGMMPNKVGKGWKRLDGDEYVDDPGIMVSTVLYKPAKLRVHSPNKQQKCSGEYALVAGSSPNGHPLWRQLGGKYWLYSGTNGMWLFGSSGAKEKNFECSRGVIYSNMPHGGVMPDRLQSTWLCLSGNDFQEDSSIVVEGDSAAQRRSEAVLRVDESKIGNAVIGDGEETIRMQNLKRQQRLLAEDQAKSKRQRSGNKVTLTPAAEVAKRPAKPPQQVDLTEEEEQPATNEKDDEVEEIAHTIVQQLSEQAKHVTSN